MAGWAPSALAQQWGAGYARAILARLPNARLGRLRVVSPTASSLLRGKKESGGSAKREHPLCAEPSAGRRGSSLPQSLVRGLTTESNKQKLLWSWEVPR